METISSEDQDCIIQESSIQTFKTPITKNIGIRQRSGTYAGFTETEASRIASPAPTKDCKDKAKIEKLLNERRKFSRQNKWGNCSYKDLIVAAIESSPMKKMTLNDIYEWIVKNIQYFKNDSDTNSSVAWKNSVRHNLSLHPIFQKEAPVAGGSRSIGSYWRIDRSKDKAKGRGRAKTLPMQDLQSARVRRTEKTTSGRKSKSKVTKTGQQRRDSTPYNDSSFKKNVFNKPSDSDHPINELNKEFFKMGNPSSVPSSENPQSTIVIPDDGDEQVTIQVRVPYEAFRLYREGTYNICILPKNQRHLRQYSKAVPLENPEYWEVNKHQPESQHALFKYPHTAPTSTTQCTAYQMPSTSTPCFSAPRNQRALRDPSTSREGVNIFRCPPLPTRLHSQPSMSHQLHHHHQRQHILPMRLSQQASSSLQIHYEEPSEQQEQPQNIQIDEMETFELHPIDNHALTSSNDQETHLLTMIDVKNDDQQNNNQNQFHDNRGFVSHQVVTSQVQHQHAGNLGISFAGQQFQNQLNTSQRIQLPELQRNELSPIMQQHLQMSQQHVPHVSLQHSHQHNQLMQMAQIQQPQINPQNQTGNKGGLIECALR